MLYSLLEPQTHSPSFVYDDYTDLIESAGSHTFSAAVSRTLNSVVGVDEFMAFLREDSTDSPCVLLSGGDTERASKRAEAYRGRYFRFDPLNRVFSDSTPRGTYVARVRSEEINNSDYRRLCYTDPGFSEKLAMAQKTAEGWIVLSVFRRQIGGGFSEHDVELLGQLGQLLLPIIGAHCRFSKATGRSQPLSIADIEMRVRAAFPRLSGRECSVCARTLAGVTAEGIAIDLGIKQTSVLTYRRRAYERLNINTVHQLSTMLLR